MSPFTAQHNLKVRNCVIAGTSADTAGRALEEILLELSRMSAEGIPVDEIEAGKNQLKGQLTLSLESPASRMFRVASAALYDEPFLPLDETLARIDGITTEQVAQACQELFSPERQTIVTLGRTADLP